MVTIHLKGRVTKSGKLDIEIPEDFPVGEVSVTLEAASPEAAPLTVEELAELMKPDPKTGSEIVAELEAGLIGDGWSDLQMTGAEWVEEQRRREAERRGLPKW